jgi:hypothetical protein
MKNGKWKMENLSSCAEQATALVDSGSYLNYLFNSEARNPSAFIHVLERA